MNQKKHPCVPVPVTFHSGPYTVNTDGIKNLTKDFLEISTDFSHITIPG